MGTEKPATESVTGFFLCRMFFDARHDPNRAGFLFAGAADVSPKVAIARISVPSRDSALRRPLFTIKRRGQTQSIAACPLLQMIAANLSHTCCRPRPDNRSPRRRGQKPWPPIFMKTE
jgi:hypothetical protein